MRLYYSPGTCSLAPHIVAREAGVDLTIVKVDLASKKTADGRDFVPLNPKGYVPALEIQEGRLLTEGVAIMQYLADLKESARLAPTKGTLDHYRLLEMLGYISTELHKPYGPLFRPNVSAELRAESIATIKRRYTPIEQQLEGKGWLFAKDFTIADAYLFVVTNWASMVNVDLGEFPNLRAFQGRAASRPAVRAAMVAEGLLAAA